MRISKVKLKAARTCIEQFGETYSKRIGTLNLLEKTLYEESVRLMVHGLLAPRKAREVLKRFDEHIERKRAAIEIANAARCKNPAVLVEAAKQPGAGMAENTAAN